MNDHRPAVLLEMFDDGPASELIEGESNILITYNDCGGMKASGKFKNTDGKLQNFKLLLGKLFQYEGFAFEADNGYEIRATMTIKQHYKDEYELETVRGFLIVNHLRNNSLSNPRC